ncbi:hypothetical protein SAMN05444157_1491 [Frankineae bacterium MT45]|nr:hypothetical protein SAMN05444157_1491 [Frankineae bacterium MT45]
MTLISVYADLLPQEIVEGRKEKLSRTRGIAAMGIALALVLVGDGVARWHTSNAQSELNAAVSAGNAQMAKTHTYSELVNAQAGSAQISSELKSLFATDLQWEKLLSQVRATAPAGLTISSIDAGLNNSKTAGAAPLSATAANTVGLVTLTGLANDPSLVATMLDTLAQVPGVVAPTPTSLNQSTGGYSFSATFNLSPSALNGKYVQASPTPKVGK